MKNLLKPEENTILSFILIILMSLLLVSAGTFHLIRPEIFLLIMPEILPYKLTLVYLSGIIEIVLGILILIRKHRKAAAILIIFLFIAIFPANIYMALHSEIYPEISPLVRWIRLPLQGLLIAWAYWISKLTK